MTHPLDAALMAATPTVAAPKYGRMEPLEASGQRYVVARDGLYLEIRRGFVHMMVPVGHVASPTPYGAVTARVVLLCGRPPMELLQRFKREAARAAPFEHAAWLTWQEGTGQWRYREVHAKDVSASRVHYGTPALENGEWRVLDMHSHGCAPAYFSAQDNADDFGAVKLSLVLGNCDKGEMTRVMRICALGMFLDQSWIKAMEVADEACVS
jgi:PRTRC genetic system protein A